MARILHDIYLWGGISMVIRRAEPDPPIPPATGPVIETGDGGGHVGAMSPVGRVPIGECLGKTPFSPLQWTRGDQPTFIIPGVFRRDEFGPTVVRSGATRILTTSESNSLLTRYSLVVNDGTGDTVIPISDSIDSEYASTPQLMARAFYQALTNPTPMLRFLTEAALRETGREKMVIRLKRLEPGSRDGEPIWSYNLRGVHMTNTYTGTAEPVPTSYVNRLGEATGPVPQQYIQGSLQHESGHHLMYFLYGENFPNYRGHNGHDMEAESYATALTNPGAGWAEGFANGLMVGAEPASMTPEMLLTDNSEWPSLPLSTRVSNEFVIEAILYEYIGGEGGENTAGAQTALDETSFDRVEKILGTLEQAGLQEDFGEFVADFLFLHPEEGDRFREILARYHMADVADGPNFIERFIARYEKPQQSPLSVQRQAWNRVNGGDNRVRNYLLNPDVPPEQRANYLNLVRSYIDQCVQYEINRVMQAE